MSTQSIDLLLSLECDAFSTLKDHIYREVSHPPSPAAAKIHCLLPDICLTLLMKILYIQNAVSWFASQHCRCLVKSKIFFILGYITALPLDLMDLRWLLVRLCIWRTDSSSSSSSKTFISQRYKNVRVSSNENYYPSPNLEPLPTSN